MFLATDIKLFAAAAYHIARKKVVLALQPSFQYHLRRRLLSGRKTNRVVMDDTFCTTVLRAGTCVKKKDKQRLWLAFRHKTVTINSEFFVIMKKACDLIFAGLF